MTLFAKIFTKLLIILYDPIVDNQNLAGAVAMWVRINTVWSAMSGPACVGDT